MTDSYQDRIRRIQDKLEGMNLDIEYEKHQKLSAVDQQINFVDDKVADWHHTD